MPLTGIEIYKLLPKTNCGKCGVPTCLAFAMQLAAGKAELAVCTTVSEEAKEKLSEASAPPIRQITLGCETRTLKMGGETVLFRHEKRFENPPGLAILVSDNLAEAEIQARLDKLNKLQYERVGLNLRPEAVAIKNESGQADKFAAVVSAVKGKTDGVLVLMSENPEALAAAAKACAERKPLLYAATAANADKMAAIAKENNCALVAKGANLEEVAQLTDKLGQAGI